MFRPSLVHHRSCKEPECLIAIPDRFGILCWNVHKNNQKADFALFLKDFTKRCEIDFLLLQEANFEDKGLCSLENFTFDAAANLEVNGSFFGVLTASKTESAAAKAYLSDEKESLIGTHKSLLLSRYLFGDGKPLLVLNIHAINFRESSSYERELKRFLDRIGEYGGAMIVAGDFNSWSTARTDKLMAFMGMLGLDYVPFAEKEKIKSFMGKHLDFIFYRGLRLIDSMVPDEHNLSDHNPLFAEFEKI